MTAHQTTIVSPSTATPIASDADTRLLKKIHATRPMLAERERRKNIAAFPPIPAI